MAESLIGDVPSDWTQQTLGDLCASGGGDVQTGPFGSQLHASDYVPVGVPTVMPTNIGDNRIVKNGIARITLADAERLARYRLRAGDIVYSRRGDVERRAIVRAEEDGWLCGTGSLRVRVGEDADSSWLSYYLGHPEVRAWIVRHAVGATMPNLNSAILSALPVVIPPLPIQRAIAEVLGALDEKIDTNLRTIQLEEELATGVLEQGPDRIPLQDIASVQRVIIDPTSFGATTVDHFSLPAFDEHRLPIRQAGAEIKSNKQRIDDVSVLVSRLNPHIPRIWYAVPEMGVVGAASTEFVVLTSLNNVAPEELWAGCNSTNFASALTESVTGTTGSHQRVQATDVLSTEVGDPRALTATERESIVDLVKEVSLLRKESVSLVSFRDTLLPRLLSGELRVSDVENLVEESSMRSFIAESGVEEVCLDYFADLRWDVLYGPDIAPDEAGAERASYRDVLLEDRLRTAIGRLNPFALRRSVVDEVVATVRRPESADVLAENWRIYKLLTQGVPDRAAGRAAVNLVTTSPGLWTSSIPSATTSWLSTSITVERTTKAPGGRTCSVRQRPSARAVLELKVPGEERATLRGAYDQLRTYAAQIPSLLAFNAVCVISTGTQARIGPLGGGSSTTPRGRRSTARRSLRLGAPEMEVLVRGVFEPATLPRPCSELHQLL